MLINDRLYSSPPVIHYLFFFFCVLEVVVDLLFLHYFVGCALRISVGSSSLKDPVIINSAFESPSVKVALFAVVQ